MAGVKGKSGRLTYKEQYRRGELGKLCTQWIIDNWDEFTKAEKLKVSLTIAPKMMVETRAELHGEVPADLIQKETAKQIQHILKLERLEKEREQYRKEGSENNDRP